MTDAFGDSSDAVRSARPLVHAQRVTFDGPWELELGGTLDEVTVVYETYGELTTARDNAVLVCHALSGDSHVARHDADDDPGWWDIVVGPGKPIDTDRYFVICPNVLGGCRGTTGPSEVNPRSGRPFGRDFPSITIADMVAVQRRLVTELGIETLLAVVGGSMGGLMVLEWARRYPDAARGLVPLGTAARLSSQALAFDVVARNAILHDPDFHAGQYYGQASKPNTGLAIARMIGHITYLSREAMAEKFGADRLSPREVSAEFEKTFSVGSYLGYQGTKFVERFDANSYITLSMAMDLFDLGGSSWQLASVFKPCDARWLVVSFSSDWLFPPEQSRQIVDALAGTNKPVSYCNVESSCGHDALLLPHDVDMYGGLIRGFLANLDGLDDADDGEHAPTGIFRKHRLDYDRMLELIPLSASVLDLGCGEGELLRLLTDRDCARVCGVDADQHAVRTCVGRGLDVIHADLNEGLPEFADRQFDYVVLSRTLQAVRDVERIVDEMLRVGRRCVVTFPNFAYHKLRRMLAEKGRAPQSTGQLPHAWYETPNIRFFSIADFEQFCADKNITVQRRITLDTEAGREVNDEPNRNADLAIFVVSR
ncbi:MAG: homoserine O-acetyltransferase [Phycisphaerae bacterium]|nr:homoserine O-acetyltransferase [Phycisphaerae bacterium]